MTRHQVLWISVAIGASLVVIWFSGPPGTSSEGPGAAAPEDLRPFEYHINDPSPTGNGTALVAQLSARQEGRLRIGWTNSGRWSDTRAVIFRNDRLHDLAPRTVASASFARRYETNCGRTPGESGDRCPSGPATMDGGFTTTGRIVPGPEILYGAAFGAEDADLDIEIESEHPLQIGWSLERPTEIHPIAPAGRTNGTINLTVRRASYAIVTPVGDYNRTPTFRIDGHGDNWTFRRVRQRWFDGAGNPVALPAFPMAPGRYTVEATGGRPPIGTDVETPLLFLSRIIEPGFVDADGRFQWANGEG